MAGQDEQDEGMGTGIRQFTHVVPQVDAASDAIKDVAFRFGRRESPHLDDLFGTLYIYIYIYFFFDGLRVRPLGSRWQFDSSCQQPTSYPFPFYMTAYLLAATPGKRVRDASPSSGINRSWLCRVVVMFPNSVPVQDHLRRSRFRGGKLAQHVL